MCNEHKSNIQYTTFSFSGSPELIDLPVLSPAPEINTEAPEINNATSTSVVLPLFYFIIYVIIYYYYYSIWKNVNLAIWFRFRNSSKLSKLKELTTSQNSNDQVAPVGNPSQHNQSSSSTTKRKQTYYFSKFRWSGYPSRKSPVWLIFKPVKLTLFTITNQKKLFNSLKNTLLARKSERMQRAVWHQSTKCGKFNV